MKVEFNAIIMQTGAIEPMKKGFRQNNIFHIPELRDDLEDRVTRTEQFFQVEIYSTSQTDSRFLKPEQTGQKKTVSCYLNGLRWMQQGRFDYTYFTRLNLIELKEVK